MNNPIDELENELNSMYSLQCDNIFVTINEARLSKNLKELFLSTFSKIDKIELLVKMENNFDERGDLEKKEIVNQIKSEFIVREKTGIWDEKIDYSGVLIKALEKDPRIYSGIYIPDPLKNDKRHSAHRMFKKFGII
jgi:hypothetical protein